MTDPELVADDRRAPEAPAPPTRQGGPDEPDPGPFVDLDADIGSVKATQVLRRGLAASPELKTGIRLTAAMALAGAVGKLTIPILIQVVLDRGIEDGEVRAGFVAAAALATAGAVLGTALLMRATYIRLIQTAERALMRLRVRAFEHLHQLSLAEHTATRKGVLTARVTSDVDTLAQFAQWGAISWIVNTVLILGTLAVMTAYSWRLTLVVLVTLVPLVPVLNWMQKRQRVAYDRVRTRVGQTLSAASETVTGIEVIRTYGYSDRVARRLDDVVDQQYRAHVGASRYFAVILPVTDVFGVFAMATVIGVGVWWGDTLGLTSGELVAFVFLVNLLLSPISELGEVLDQTQTAMAGWWKVLQVLDLPVTLPEPARSATLPRGPLPVRTEGVRFAYATGPEVLHGIDVDIDAESAVAVVGETGSGKTTFAKLLVRLADPTSGSVRVGGIDLRDVGPEERRARIRMVPQDGFLFETTVGENVRFGRAGAGREDVEAAFEALGLGWWLDRLPDGLDTPVGQRGERLSVGERQLVALARAELGDPGLLILDEATSAVDPETELALSEALGRLAVGRTTITIAHRLSTAERADLVLVFDAGTIVERGPHEALVARGGVYAGLYESWLGNTRDEVA